MSDSQRLTAQQFQDIGGLGDWRVLSIGASAWFDAPSHAAGAALVCRVAALAEAAGHRPDIDLRASGVHVRTRTDAASGLTERDVSLARAVSAAARDLGLSADPSAVQAVQLTVDTLDKASVMPFWRAALGYQPRGDADLVDAMRRDPMIWFQQMDVARPLRNRVHVDVGVPHDLAPDRVAAVKEAGGREAFAADYYVTLADAEGNEVDVAPLTPESDLAEESESADWRVLFGAMAHYRTATYERAAQLAATVAELADEAQMALLVDVRAGGVTIDTGTDRWGRRTVWRSRRSRPIRGARHGSDRGPLATSIRADRDRRCRHRRSSILLARRARLPPRRAPRRHRHLRPSAAQPTPVLPAPVHGRPSRRAQRNRIHVDVFVPDDQAAARIESALTAGGRVVYDAEAPEWWTLADPEGNEVDIAVSVGREEIWLAG